MPGSARTINTRRSRPGSPGASRSGGGYVHTYIRTYSRHRRHRRSRNPRSEDVTRLRLADSATNQRRRRRRLAGARRADAAGGGSVDTFAAALPRWDCAT